MKIDEDFWQNINARKRNELERIFADEQGELSQRVSNAMLEIMAQENVSSAELSRRLDSSRASITNTIKPGRNMTLRTLVKFAWVLGYRVDISFEKIGKIKEER